jgi:hypothetical protein
MPFLFWGVHRKIITNNYLLVVPKMPKVRCKPLNISEIRDNFRLDCGYLQRKNLRTLTWYNVRISTHRYTCVIVGKRQVRIHRLLWVLYTGEDPWPHEIDHVDGNIANNTWDNLRLAPNGSNNANARRHRAGHLVGCTYDSRRPTKPWYSRFKWNQKTIGLGSYKTEQEAHERYLIARTLIVEMPIWRKR